jgi:hypothetical protein
MQKKLLCVILAISIIFCFNIVSFAQDDTTKLNSKITRDTVITEDNLNEILNLYGIDPSTAKKSNTPMDKAAVTVGQLEDAINLIKQEVKENLTMNKTIDNSNLVSSDSFGIIRPMSTFTGYLNLSNTTQPTSAISLTHSVRGYFTKDTSSGNAYWTGADNAGLIFTDNSSPGAKRQLKTINYISSTYNSSTITVSSSADIDYYIVVGIPKTPASYDYYMSTSTITSKVYWGPNYLP